MLLKKIIYTTVLVALLGFSANAVSEPTVSAESAVVINAQTKEVFYEKNAYEKRSMASTTKIMTSLIAVESGRLYDTVTAKNFSAEGTSIGLKDGYVLNLEALVYGMLLESGNDAAKLTANYLAGDETNFSVLMNKKAKEIGMMSTNFVTASGLDDENHYSTAYDMALLGAYAISNPLFRDICSTKTKTVKYIKPNMSVTFSNHNRLLNSCEGVFGIKTGFTKKSGRCLISACSRDGIDFVIATLNAPDDWNDHKKLYDYVFDEIETQELEIDFSKRISVYGGDKTSVQVKTDKITLHLKSIENVTSEVILPQIIYAPISKGDVLGKLLYYKNDTLIYSADIYSDEIVQQVPETINFWQQLKEKLLKFK